MFRENIIAELKEKIANNPSDVENYRNLANYYIGCEDLNNAVLMYKEILKLDACDYQSLINIGSIWYFQKFVYSHVFLSFFEKIVWLIGKNC